MKKTRIIVLMGLFIALNVILTRIVRPVELPHLRVSFGFVATSLSSIVLGPLLSGVAAAFADVIGYFLFPSGSGFFPGFTFSALLTGIIYGLFLYKKPVSFLRVILSVLVVSLVIDIGLNTLWLSILLKTPWMVLFGSRIVKTAIMYPIQVVLIYTTWRYIGAQIRKIVKV